MELFYGMVGVFGLIVGSFLNVVITRFGFSEEKRPRSACQSCGHSLQWFELIPLLSFFMVRGKCRVCGSRLALHYPLVEGGMGVVFLLAAASFTPSLAPIHLATFVAVLFFLAIFFLLVVYDIRHTLIPSPFSGLLIVGACALRTLEAFEFRTGVPLLDAMFGVVALGGFIALLVMLTRGRGMGAGDVYVAVAMGIVFGLARGIEVMALAFWIGAVYGIGVVAISYGGKKFFPRAFHALFRQGGTMKSEVPFVPFLFIATLIGMYTHFSPFMFVGHLLSL